MICLATRVRATLRRGVLLACLFSPALFAETVLRLGVVPQYASGDVHHAWGPLVERLNVRLPFRLTLETAADIPTFERRSLEGAYDFAYINPYHLESLYWAQGYTPLLADVGEPVRGVLVSRKNSGLDHPAQLDGRSLAFPAPNALGASLLLRRDLAERFDLAITPHYVNSHSSVYLNVALGLSVAGGGIEKTLDHQPDEIRQRLQVIHRTEPVPSHPIVVHPRVPESVWRTLVAAMEQLTRTDDGQAILRGIPIHKLGRVTYGDYELLWQTGLEAYHE